MSSSGAAMQRILFSDASSTLGLNRFDPACELFDPALSRVELRRADGVELLAALPERDRLVEARLSALEPLDDRLQLALGVLEASARSARVLDASPRSRRCRARRRPACRSRPRSSSGRSRRLCGRSRSRGRASPAETVLGGGRPSARPPHADARPAGAVRGEGGLASASSRRRSRSRARRAPRGEGRPRSLEAGGELCQVRDDEARGCGRRRGARVGDEVGERRVLLVTDRGDDRDRAGGDRAHEPFVAEREEVLEAPAAAGEDDDVDLGRLRRSRAARRRSRARRAGPGRTSRRRECGPAESAR